MEGGILMSEQRSQVRASLLELQGYFGEWKAGRGQGRIRCLLLAAGVGCCMGCCPCKGTFARIIYTWKATLFISGVISPYTRD